LPTDTQAAQFNDYMSLLAAWKTIAAAALMAQHKQTDIHN